MAGQKRRVFLILDGHPIHKSARLARKVNGFDGSLAVVPVAAL